MSYLKSLATSFVYVAFFLAIITFAPRLPPNAVFSEYSVTPPSALEGVFAPNEKLNNPEVLFNGELKGAEAFDSYRGELYTGMHGGYVGKIVGNKIVPVVKFGKKCDGVWQEEKCGRPLGLKFDSQGQLYVADTYYGIFRVNVDTGKYEKLFDPSKPIGGKAPMLINCVDITKNGDVYWTDSSSEFKLYDGIYAMFANPSGRLMRYNAATKKNEVLLENLGFANGLKLAADDSYVVVAETMKTSITKYHLKGSKAGKSEILIDGLPGSPDNIQGDGFGNFFASLIMPADPEHPQISQVLAPHPYLRKMIVRLMSVLELPFKLLDDVYPNDIAKKAAHALGSFETFSFAFPPKATIVRFNGNGKILDVLHNTDEKVSAISSAFVHGDYLWLGSPINTFLARVPLKQAFPSGEFSVKKHAHETVAQAKPTTTTPRPTTTTTTPKPTTTTPKPTTTTPKPTTTTPKPTTTTTPKPATTTTPKPTTPKPTTTTQKPTTTTTQKPTTTTPKPTTTQKPTAKPVKVAQQAKPVPNVQEQPATPQRPVVREETDELPRPIDMSETPHQSKNEEPVKHNTKFVDEM